jgi:hypothetical protein
VIDLRAEQSFGRFWLPLIILGLLVLVLFPSFGPRQERIARERWDGLIVVLTLAEPAKEPLRVLATMPLRARPRTMPLGPLEEERSLARERLVIGEARIETGARSVPLLLATPTAHERHARLNRRVLQDPSWMHGVVADFEIRRETDLTPAAQPWFGAVIGPGQEGDRERIDTPAVTGEAASPLLSFTRSVTMSPTAAELRWIGDPATFLQDWARFQREEVGSLSRFIHERWSLAPRSEWAAQATDGAAAERR